MVFPSGRWSSAWLMAGTIACFLAVARPTSAVTIDKVLPFTPAVDGVRIQVSVGGDAQPAQVDLSATISPVGPGKSAVWKGPLGRADVPALGTATVEKMLIKLPVKPWSPGSPNLYDLSISVTRAGRSVATKVVRFGFRTFESKSGNFYLNGKPIFLRGLAINPPGRTVPDNVGESRQFAYDYVKYLRGQNLNLIRLDHDNQDWFDVCDELGMMVYQGFYGSPPSGLSREEEQAQKTLATQDEAEGKKLPRDLERSVRAYRETFEAYVRHPSIVIYVLTNEMPYKGEEGKLVHDFLSKAYDRLSQWDHTRLYIGNAGYGEGHEGDVNDVHRYWGWYYNSFLTYYNLRDAKLFGEFDRNQPLTFSECVGCFTGPNGAFNCIERKQLAAALGWTGHASNQSEEAQAYQAFMVKQATESFRRLRSINPRISGLMPFTITFHNWRGVKSFAQMKPTAAAKQFGISYQPVLLSWENWTPQAYGGTKIKVFAHVINDADDASALKGAKLWWSLTGPEGGKYLTQQMDIPEVPYYGTWRIPIEIPLPATWPTWPANLVGRIIKDGKVISTNETPVFIAGSDWKKPRPGQKKIVIYDPPGKTFAAAQALNIAAQRITKLDDVLPDELLVIGEQSWDNTLAAQGKTLLDFIRSGGRVLCLGQSRDKFDPSWLPAKIEMCSRSPNEPDYMTAERPAFEQGHVNPERPDHPVFAGVDRERLKLWSDPTNWDQTKPGFPRIYPLRFGFKLVRQDDLAHMAILADYDRGLEGVALAEMFDGKGSLMLCALDLIGHAGIDPIADRILANLLAYMASDKGHELHPTITSPIRWGDFASERGVIGGPLYGLFRNTDWVPPTDPGAKPLTDRESSWNSKASDQFVPHGIRPRGPFHYTFNCGVREGTKSEQGSGIFWASVPAGRRNVLNRVKNPTDRAATLQIDINSIVGEPITIPAGKTIDLRTSIPAGATDVGVRYTGERELIILETAFQ